MGPRDIRSAREGPEDGGADEEEEEDPRTETLSDSEKAEENLDEVPDDKNSLAEDMLKVSWLLRRFEGVGNCDGMERRQTLISRKGCRTEEESRQFGGI
jgi:hypothetical protein